MAGLHYIKKERDNTPGKNRHCVIGETEPHLQTQKLEPSTDTTLSVSHGRASQMVLHILRLNRKQIPQDNGFYQHRKELLLNSFLKAHPKLLVLGMFLQKVGCLMPGWIPSTPAAWAGELKLPQGHPGTVRSPNRYRWFLNLVPTFDPQNFVKAYSCSKPVGQEPTYTLGESLEPCWRVNEWLTCRTLKGSSQRRPSPGTHR